MNGVQGPQIHAIRRIPSGELRQVLHETGFPNAQLTRLGDDHSIQIDLGVPVIEPAVLREPLHVQTLRTQLAQLNTQIVGGESVSRRELETILHTNPALAFVPRTNFEGELNRRGVALHLNSSTITDIANLKRDPTFVDRLTERSYTDSLDVILAVTRMLQEDVLQVGSRDIVLFLGPTRSGKSTTMLYLDGRPLVLRNTADLGLPDTIADEVMVPADHPLDESIIGHNTSVSHTFFPSIYPNPLRDHHMVDFPGLLDSSGWQVRIGLDMVLKDIIKRARSVKVVAILDDKNFSTAGGAIAVETAKKLKTIDTNIAACCVVGVTKKNGRWRAAFQNAINHPEDGAFPGFTCIKVNQADSNARQALETEIFSKTPVTPMEPRDRFDRTVVSAHDIVAFGNLLIRTDTIKALVDRTLKVKGLSQDTQPAADTNLFKHLEHMTKLYELAEFFKSKNVSSILAAACPQIKDIMALKDSGLIKEIYKAEREVANTIFKLSVNRFETLWNLLIQQLEHDKTRLSPIHKQKLEEKYQEIKNRIEGLLKLKNITFEECQPENFLERTAAVCYRGVSLLLSPITQIAGLFLGQNENAQAPYETARTNTRNCHQIIRDRFEALGRDHWFADGHRIQAATVAFTAVDITLDAMKNLIEASFTRGIMLDSFTNELK